MPSPIYDTSKSVLVTGATGFLAGWIVKRLLEEGFTVHSAVRDPSQKDKIAPLEALADNTKGSIKFFAADLLKEGSYTDAMAGCSTVFHTASPFTSKITDPQRDLVDPAVKGTRNVLNTANEIKSVARIVVTSSCAAIYGDNADIAKTSGGIFTEADWNTSSHLDHQAYSFSKVEAEKAAWDIARAQDRWKLVTINPALIMGPSISGSSTSESHNLVKQMADGTMKPGAPPLELGVVDVRDVAEAHLRVAFMPEAEGRHIVFTEAVSFLDLANMLRAKYGDKFPFPKSELPKWLLWLVGPIINKSVKREMVSKNMGLPWRADNSKSIKTLGMTYAPVSVAMTDMLDQMIETGAVKPKA